MSTDVTTAVGTFVWHEHISTEPKQAQEFYGKLLGWEYEVFKPGEMDYAMIKSGDTTHGGFGRPEGDIPPHWLGHILVEDVDETARKAEAAGGSIAFGPMDIPEVGRFAIVRDPQGAAVSLFASSGEGPVSGGVFVWDELHTSDVAGAKSFYGEVFGWTASDQDMGGGTTYTMFERGDRQVAGGFPLQEGVPAPHWLPYIHTDDVQGTTAKARELGATIHVEPAEIPNIGWFAVLQDPIGATVGLFKPTNQ